MISPSYVRLVRSFVACAVLMVTGSLFAADATTPPATQPAASHPPADQPAPRGGKAGKTWLKRHDGLVEKAKAGNVDLYFEGDSITDFWSNGRKGRDGTTPPATGSKVWNENFLGWNPGNFGISGDRTEMVLWRMENGELDGVKPKAIVLMIGTNNAPDSTSEEVASGVTAIVNKFKEKEPQAKILLLAIFPRDASPDSKLRKTNDGANKIIATLDDGGKTVKFLNINDKFLTPDGTLTKEIMPDLLHPSAQGYEIWAAAIKPTLIEWLGEPKPPAAPVSTPAQ